MKLLITYVVLPLLIFLVLTLSAIYLILHRSLVDNGPQFEISAICEPSLDLHPPNLASPDTLLCGTVVFFRTLLDTAPTTLLAVVFSTVGVVAFIPFLEAARDRPPSALRMPTAVGILFLLGIIGVTIPLYALLFVTTYTASLRPSTASRINQRNAKALLFGLLLGYAFPLLIALVTLAVLAYKIIRSSHYVHSAHFTVMVTLAFTCLLSALLHTLYVRPTLTHVHALQAIFVPVMDTVDPLATSLADGVLEFIKWDVIFSLGSVMLATLWIADSLVSLLGILVWYAVVGIAAGPAAAIAGVFLWRERRLNGQTQAEDKVLQ